jgi:Extensin-like protein C-terminus
MARRVLPNLAALSALGALVGALAGCALWVHDERAQWRALAEESCLSQGLVHVSGYVQSAAEIDGPGVCGLVHPFKVAALAGETIMLSPTQTLACPMLPALDQWLLEVVQPAAQADFGQAVVEIKSLGSYGCRSMNNQYGAALSEHSFANAIDIGGFKLADGRTIDVMRGWKGDEVERAFLHRVHAGACRYFNTVLGPGSDAFHYNHIHVDLARHAVQRDGTMHHICKPIPAPELSDPQNEPAPVAQNQLRPSHRPSAAFAPWPSAETDPAYRQTAAEPLRGATTEEPLPSELY